MMEIEVKATIISVCTWAVGTDGTYLWANLLPDREEGFTWRIRDDLGEDMAFRQLPDEVRGALIDLQYARRLDAK